VSRSERELVMTLRAELAAIDPSRPCDRLAEAAGLGSAAPAREGPVTRLALRLGRGRGSVAAVAAADDGAAAVDRAGAVDGAGSEWVAARREFDWDRSAEHCRLAYLRGLFLAHGSLSLAGGRTHLEFVVGIDEAEPLTARLSAMSLPAAWRIRRGRGVVTWKNGDTIGLFLRRIGAGGALLEVEARQVSRALRGDLNRVLNAESANLQRAVGAAGRQIAAIDELEVDGRLAEQPYAVRLVADARRTTPEATLGELAERLGLHRSAVQRALERVERLALHADEGVGRRVQRPRSVRSRSPRPPAGRALA
jgi:DNA-binding transcriptional ArsR family regulator